METKTRGEGGKAKQPNPSKSPGIICIPRGNLQEREPGTVKVSKTSSKVGLQWHTISSEETKPEADHNTRHLSKFGRNYDPKQR